MADLQGTKTEKNLQEAFAGESMARNKYTYFAKVAKKEGYEQVAALFLATAEQEQAHAKLHFKLLDGMGDTLANLEAAAAGENYEWTDMYPRMAAEAREEGFEDIAKLFDGIATVEKEHNARYTTLLENLKSGAVFERPEKVRWVCRKCGFTYEGTKAITTCPVCKHPQGYFEIAASNF